MERRQGQAHVSKHTSSTPAPELVLGGVVYQNAADAMARCRAMLAGKAGFDGAFVDDVFRMHPHAKKKAGPGVVRHFIAPGETGLFRFWARLVDGSEVSWNYKKCFVAEDPRSLVRKTFRTEVRSDTQAFRERTLHAGSVCALSGVSLAGLEVHVDHVPPASFHAILEDFLKQKNLRLEQIGIALPEADGPPALVDRTLAAEWRSWHAGRARLRLVSLRAHLARKKHG